MEDVTIPKEEGLRIALSIVSGKTNRKEVGSSALRETELILKNILNTIEVEKEIAKKPQAKQKKPNKKHALSPSQKKNLDVAERYIKKLTGKTIRDLELS